MLNRLIVVKRFKRVKHEVLSSIPRSIVFKLEIYGTFIWVGL